jgi:ABC-2 type transport system ATP-binding protein
VLVHDPQLLLLDEPLSGLDPIAQADMLSLLAEFRGRGGASLFSTHSMTAAEKICDRVVMLSAGRTVFRRRHTRCRGAFAIWRRSGHGGCRRAWLPPVRWGHVVPLAAGMGEAAVGVLCCPECHPSALIRAMAERGVPFFNFQPIEANLGAFWIWPALGAEEQGGMTSPLADRRA